METRKNILCGCIYRHPSSSITEFNEKFVVPILTKLSNENKTCILVGDFNINLLNCSTNNVTSDFYQNMCSNYFVPYILQPTRVTLNSQTPIDNIFMNSLEYETASGNFDNQISDHLIQYLLLKNFYKKKSSGLHKRIERDFRFFNNDEFKRDISLINWNTIFSEGDINLCFDTFYKTLLYYLDEHAPMKVLSKRKISLKMKPWIIPNIKHLMNIQNTLFGKYRKTLNPILKKEKFESYKVARNNVTKEITSAKKQYYENFFKSHWNK